MRYVPFSHLLKRIKISFWSFLLFLCLISFVFPQKVGDVADISAPPNPAKAPWFLLWIQELVGYSFNLIYFVIIIFLSAFFLPYLFPKTSEKARWFSKDQFVVNILISLLQIFILIFTVLAIFRGKNWHL